MMRKGRRQPAGRSARRGRVSAALACMILSCLVADGGSSAEPDRFDIVVIDPGHGGKDHGALGQQGLAEKDLVLDVSQRLGKRLERGGLRVVMTRKGDTFVPLERRTSVANDARGDLFISIHANSASSAEPRGTETYFVSLESSDRRAQEVATRENEAFGSAAASIEQRDPLLALLGDMIVSEHVSESSEFAKMVEHEFVDVDAKRSRGVKQAPFVVLMGVQMPASLIEIGFLSNPKDEKSLRSDRHRDALVDAMASAVLDFGKRYDSKRGVEARAAR
jgi:N-acetylmuramoyl-L-alanine amidase